MDYKKSGGARSGKGAPRHQEKGAPGGPDNPFGKSPKAKGDKERPGKGGKFDKPQTGAEDFAIDERGTKNIRGTEEISNDNDESIAHRDD
jgi:hypothetical protein